MKRIIFGLAFSLLLAGCASEQKATPLGSASPQSTYLGKSFPEIDLANYQTAAIQSSREITSGKIVNLWASWCEPCQREFPLMAQPEYVSSIVAINVNDLSESQAGKDQADGLVALGSDKLSVWIDTKNIATSELSVLGLPITFAVDSDGSIVDVEIGELHEDSLARLAKAASQ